MIAERVIMLRDQFTWTHFGEKWVNHSWLAQVIFGQVFAWGEEAAVVYLAQAIAGLTIFIVGRGQRTPLPQVVVILLYFVGTWDCWAARPFVFSTCCVVLTKVLLDRQDRRGFLAAAALLPLWSNLHGGYLLGLAFLAIELFLAIGRPQVAAWKAGVVGTSVLLVVLINPSHLDAILYPFRLVSSENLKAIIEWQPPVPGNVSFLVCVALLCGVLVAATFGDRLSLRDLTYLGLSAVLAFSAQRNVSVLVLVAAQIIAVRAGGIRGLPVCCFSIGKFRGRRWLSFALSVGLVFFAHRRNAQVTARIALDTVFRIPSEVVSSLGEYRRLFNTYNYGGFLIWAGNGVPVFVDGRTDFFPEEFFRRYLEISSGRDWGKYAEEFRFDAAVVDDRYPVAGAIASDPDWTELVTAGHARLYVPVGRSKQSKTERPQ